MRKTAVLITAIVVFLAVGMLISQLSFAQEPVAGKAPQSGWAIGVPLVYNERIAGDEPIITVMGKVTKIENMRGAFKDSLQMRLKTDEGEKWVVWMGPKWFILNQKIKFEPGDEVEVRGLKFKADTIIGSDISKGDWTMLLRSENDGLPNWECCVPRVRK